MTNEEKLEAIRPWVDPEERITVNFLDEQGLNAEVTDCNDIVVDLSKLVYRTSNNISRSHCEALKSRKIRPTILVTLIGH